MTADCPLIDPDMTDRVIRDLIGHSDECDYASNVIRRTYPRGLDVEAMFRDTLERLDRLVHSAAGREHVTVFILRERPNLFLSRSLEDTEDNADLRWTVDVPDDLAMMRIIYEELALDQQWHPYREVLRYVREHPRLAAMNVHVAQASL
jgi:spore coat polysaccharide biosynthesis protein SpsF